MGSRHAGGSGLRRVDAAPARCQVAGRGERLGADVAKGVFGFYVAAALLALAAGALADLAPAFFVLALAYAAHLLWQPSRLRPDDPARALALFKSNRDAGLILFAAFALGAFQP